MNCSKARLFLSDYLNGTLNQQTETQIREHLASCNECSGETAFLKTYLKKAGALDKMEAPPDFLARVQQRLERPASFKMTIMKILWPSPLKIPQLVGVMAVVVLLVFLVNSLRLMVSIHDASKESAGFEMVQKEKQKPASLALDQMKSAPAAGVSSGTTRQRSAKSAVAVGEFVLTLVLKPPVLASITTERMLSENPAASGSAPVLKSEAEEERSDVKEKKTTETPSDEIEGETNLLIETVIRIKNMVIALQGNIVKVDSDSETNLPKQLILKIPARNYPVLLEKLGGIGEVTKHYAETSFNNNERVIQVRVELQP
jgi:hypothetical protein